MLPVKCEAIAIKAETTQNTAATIAATDFLLAQDVSLKPVQEYLERGYKRPTFDKVASIAGQGWVDITLKTEVRGSGTAGTAIAPLGALLQASGMSETVVASTSVAYAPVSVPASANFFTAGKSLTVEYYEGATATKTGLKHIVKGCVATGVKIVIEAGKYAMYEFSLRGFEVSVTDAVVPTTTYLTTLPPIVQNSSFTLHSFAGIISKLEVDFGCVVSKRDDVNSSVGLKGFSVTDRDPKGSCDPEAELVATFDFYTKMRTAAEGSMSIVIGATAGNITTITCPKAQFAGLDPGEREGTRTFSVPLKFNQNTGDDWISIALT